MISLPFSKERQGGWLAGRKTAGDICEILLARPLKTHTILYEITKLDDLSIWPIKLITIISFLMTIIAMLVVFSAVIIIIATADAVNVNERANNDVFGIPGLLW